MEERDRNMGGPANMPPFEEMRTRPHTDVDRDTPEHDMPRSALDDIGVHPMGGNESVAQARVDAQHLRDSAREGAITEESARREFEATVDRMTDGDDGPIRERVRRRAATAAHGAEELARGKLGEFGDRVQGRISRRMDRVADRLEHTAGRIDRISEERSRDGNRVKARAGRMGHSVADSLDSTADYLRGNELIDLRDDLRQQIREHPLRTLVLGVAAGWIAGKILR